MKRNSGWLRIVIVLALIIFIIKFVPPVNDWARGNLPGAVLSAIGENPKGIFERGTDAIGNTINKGKNAVQDLVDKVKD